MIELIPSISILDGKTVRLTQGDYQQGKTYTESPLDLAIQFEEHGFKRLHIVDLDGAKKGEVVNFDLLKRITGHTDLAIDFGGGVHNDEDVEKAYEAGAKFVTVSTMAYTNKRLLSSWFISHGRNKIILAADTINGKVAIKGRQNITELDLIEYIDYYYQKTLLYLKAADISRDGTLVGPNFDLYKTLVQQFPNLRVMASGGVRSIDDIKKLEDLGVYGVMFGKAFYEGLLTFKDFDTLLSRSA